MQSSERLRRSLASIQSELEQLYAADKIGAVQVNIVLRSGDVRTFKCSDDGFRFLLLAATAIGQREALDDANDVTRDAGLNGRG
jgi:hypothetical protein